MEGVLQRLMFKLNFAGPIIDDCLKSPNVVCSPRYPFLEGRPGNAICKVSTSKAKAESGQLVVQWMKVSIAYESHFLIRTSNY